jgi:hypothetical protein
MPAPPSRRKIRNEEKVIKEILRLYKEGVDLSSSRVLFSHGRLFDAAIEYCGPWDSAMSIAGIAPKNYRRGLEGPKPRLTGEDVIDWLRVLHQQGVEMSVKGVGSADRKLYPAILTHFDGLGIAFEKEDLEFVPHPRRSYWTGERVIKEIEKLSASGEELSHNIVLHKHPDLVYGARKNNGTWTSALKKAGIDPSSTRKHSIRTDEEVLRGLKRFYDDGKPVNTWALSRIDPRLVTTLRNRWGSHDAALKAAGLDPAFIRLK